MKRLKEIIAFVNNKGGVAKTTTVQNVAAGIVRLDKEARVLCIDLDGQCNLSYLLGWDMESASGKLTVREAMEQGSGLPVYQSESGMGEEKQKRDRLFYVPASADMNSLDYLLHGMGDNAHRALARCFRMPLRNMTDDESITNVLESFDYVLIDCPPAMSEVTYNALAIASQLLIPIQLEGMSIQGLSLMVQALKKVQNEDNEGLELLGLLRVMTNDRLNTAKGFVGLLQKQFGKKLFKSRVRRSDLINQAQSMRMNIFEYRQWEGPASDYLNVVTEIVTRCDMAAPPRP